MSLITPEFGLFFWMLIAFGVVFFLLRKFAWGPIIRGLHSRESSIADALTKAAQAEAEVKRLHAQTKEIEAEGRAARAKLIADAEKARDQMLSEARMRAKAESDRYREEAQQAIAQEREAARLSLREEVAKVSLLVTERILREKLESTPAQMAHFDKILDEVLSGK